jgi:hypothetical protein
VLRVHLKELRRVENGEGGADAAERKLPLHLLRDLALDAALRDFAAEASAGKLPEFLAEVERTKCAATFG